MYRVYKPQTSSCISGSLHGNVLKSQTYRHKVTKYIKLQKYQYPQESKTVKSIILLVR